MDADASLDPGDLPLVAGPIADGACDLMLGSRAARRGSWPLHARLANLALMAEVRRRSTLTLRDLGRCVQRDASPWSISASRTAARMAARDVLRPSGPDGASPNARAYHPAPGAPRSPAPCAAPSRPSGTWRPPSMTDPGATRWPSWPNRHGRARSRPACAPHSPRTAARLATAAILDTVAAGLSSQARRVTVVLDGLKAVAAQAGRGDPQRTGRSGPSGRCDRRCLLGTRAPGAGDRHGHPTGHRRGLDAAALPLWRKPTRCSDRPRTVVLGDRDERAARRHVRRRADEHRCHVCRTAGPTPPPGIASARGGHLADVDDFDDALSAALIAPRTQFAAELDLMLAFIDAPAAM